MPTHANQHYYHPYWRECAESQARVVDLARKTGYSGTDAEEAEDWLREKAEEELHAHAVAMGFTKEDILAEMTSGYSVGDRVHLVGTDGKHYYEVYQIAAIDGLRLTLEHLGINRSLTLIPFGLRVCGEEGCQCGRAEDNETEPLNTVDIARRCGYQGDDPNEAMRFIDEQIAEGLHADVVDERAEGFPHK